jgi:hypothetical protein
MWMQVWEFWVTDNDWTVSWPYNNFFEAEIEAIDCITSNDYDWKWNLCVVEVKWCYDNYSTGEEGDNLE